MEFKNFFESIKNNISKDKNVILVAGASNSGKTYLSQELKKFLEKDGKNVAVISADMYYKGISTTIVEKAFFKNKEFMPYIKDAKKIVAIVRSVIEYCPFGEKFKKENEEQIKTKLENLLGKDIAQKMTTKLKSEFEQINFDEPFAIHFKKLAKAINSFAKKEKVIVPDYSFKTGEYYIQRKNLIDFSKYDYLIVEGLYCLRNELLNRIDKNKVLKTSINCDIKSLLIRKFNRDIKNNRTSFTPEQTMMIFLTIVMPAYYQYIHPTIKTADLIFNATLTDQEIKNRQIDTQFKFASNNAIHMLLKANGATLNKIENHRDYFFEDMEDNGKNHIILRLRQQSNLAEKLSIKILTPKAEEKALEEYNLKECLSTENRDVNSLINKFTNSGFDIMQIVNKKRYLYELDGVKIRVDDVNDLGIFVEFEGEALNKIEKLKSKLCLENAKTKSYYELYKENIVNLVHTENEIKILVSGMSEEEFKLQNKQEIKQFYLDVTNPNVRNLINKTFANQVNFDYTEARMRVIDNKYCYITLKTGETNQRKEMEKEIALPLVTQFLPNVTKSLEKTRYTILKTDTLNIEIDFYKNQDLCIMEAEYDGKIHNENNIKNFILRNFSKEYKLEDVTHDKNYKNVNLAK